MSVVVIVIVVVIVAMTFGSLCVFVLKLCINRIDASYSFCCDDEWLVCSWEKFAIILCCFCFIFYLFFKFIILII